jgi:hypothetical protein
MVSGIEFQLPPNSEIELYSRLRKLSPSLFLRLTPLVLLPSQLFYTIPLKTPRPPLSRIRYRSLSISLFRVVVALPVDIRRRRCLSLFPLIFSRFRFSYPPFLSELSNYLSAQFSSFSNFPIK